jgi:hypothetical protein
MLRVTKIQRLVYFVCSKKFRGVCCGTQSSYLLCTEYYVSCQNDKVTHRWDRLKKDLSRSFHCTVILTHDDGHVARNKQCDVKKKLKRKPIFKSFTDRRVACKTVESVTLAKKKCREQLFGNG